jgi:hypothetical protein
LQPWRSRVLPTPSKPPPKELLGHCVELYRSNRRGAAALVTHLERYGYRPPPGQEWEPEDPCRGAHAHGHAHAGAAGAEEFCFEDSPADADAMLIDSPPMHSAFGEEGARLGAVSTSSSPGGHHRPQQPPASRRLSRSMPSSPVAAALLGGGYVPSRLGAGQPGSPARGGAAAAAAAAFALGTSAATRAAAAPGAGAARPSLGGLSAASLTPEGALSMLSPGLADKYACPSSGATDPGPPAGGGGGGAPADAQAAAHAAAALADRGGRSAACRDLRLDYSRCSSDSPNLPIFGKSQSGPTATPRSASLPSSVVSDLPSTGQLLGPGPVLALGRAGGGGAAGGRAPGSGVSTTSPLPGAAHGLSRCGCLGVSASGPGLHQHTLTNPNRLQPTPPPALQTRPTPATSTISSSNPTWACRSPTAPTP